MSSAEYFKNGIMKYVCFALPLLEGWVPSQVVCVRTLN